MPRILRDSLRTLSSSDDQPSSLSEPAQGTTFIASGAGNGDSVRACRGSRDGRRRPASPARGCRRRPGSSSWRRSMPGCPAPEAAWYDETTSSVSCHSRCSAPRASIIVRVVQLGLAMMPFGRFRTASGLTSGTTSGTSGSIRNEPELSTTTTPLAAAIGAHSAETSSGTSNIATSTPSKTSGARAWTSTCSPRTSSSLPAERAEATRRISPQTSSRVERI